MATPSPRRSAIRCPWRRPNLGVLAVFPSTGPPAGAPFPPRGLVGSIPPRRCPTPRRALLAFARRYHRAPASHAAEPRARRGLPKRATRSDPGEVAASTASRCGVILPSNARTSALDAPCDLASPPRASDAGVRRMGCGDVCLLNDEGYRAIEGSSRPPLINLTVSIIPLPAEVAR